MPSLQRNKIEACGWYDFKKKNEKLVRGIESISVRGKKNSEIALNQQDFPAFNVDR